MALLSEYRKGNVAVVKKEPQPGGEGSLMLLGVRGDEEQPSGGVRSLAEVPPELWRPRYLRTES